MQGTIDEIYSITHQKVGGCYNIQNAEIKENYHHGRTLYPQDSALLTMVAAFFIVVTQYLTEATLGIGIDLGSSHERLKSFMQKISWLIHNSESLGLRCLVGGSTRKQTHFPALRWEVGSDYTP